MTDEKLTFTLTNGAPITIDGPDMWDGWQRALNANAAWVTFNVLNGDVSIRVANVVSVVHTPAEPR